MKNLEALLFVCLGLVYGCSAAPLSPGPSLLSGLKRYESDMRSLGSSMSRWPERQRAGGNLKMVITGTVGDSPEFYRLVDLDVKRREYLITMREMTVRPERLKEMKDELIQMDEETIALKPIIRSQLATMPLTQQAQRVEGIATLGLLSLTLDSFSASKNTGTGAAPSAIIDQYVVTDLGGFSTVQSANSPMFRCLLYVEEEGAGMKCEPAK
jgi:hypothetical protein